MDQIRTVVAAKRVQLSEYPVGAAQLASVALLQPAIISQCGSPRIITYCEGYSALLRLHEDSSQSTSRRSRRVLIFLSTKTRLARRDFDVAIERVGLLELTEGNATPSICRHHLIAQLLRVVVARRQSARRRYGEKLPAA